MNHFAPADSFSAEAETSDFVPNLEAQVLGTLLHGDGYGRIRSFLRPQHFLAPAHRGLFEVIGLAHDRYGQTTFPLVAKLVSEDVAKVIHTATGGETVSVFCARLMTDATFTVAGIERAARNVIDQWARLSMLEEMQAACAAAHDPGGDPSEIAKRVGAALEEIMVDVRGAGRRRTRLTIGEAASHSVSAAREASERGNGLSGIPWGPLSDVDHMTGGMQRKDLILLGARPSMGKTSVAVAIANGVARKGHGVGFLSLEMATERVTDRALSDLTYAGSMRIPYFDMIQGRLDAEQLAHLDVRATQLAQYPIEFDDAPATTFDVRARIESMMERFLTRGWPPLELLVIDHLGCIRPSQHYRGNRNNEIGEITRALKDYAKEFDLPVLLLSQLSRQLTQREDKRPQLSDLRDSGNIEQDADVVAFVHREAYFLERAKPSSADDEIEWQEKVDRYQNKLELIIAKQRNGRVGTIDLWCDMAYSAVRNGARYQGETGR